MALQDITLSTRALEKALEKGLGKMNLVAL